MNKNDLFRAFDNVDDNILERSETPVGRRRAPAYRKWLALAACLALTVSLVGVAFAAEAREYGAAVAFFDENGLSTEGLSRSDVKAVYRDITSQHFTYDKTAEVIERAVPGLEISQREPTPEELAALWDRNVWRNTRSETGFSYRMDVREKLDESLGFDVLDRSVLECYRALLHLYRERPVLYNDTNSQSFEWIESGDVQRSIFSFIRRNPWNYNDGLIFVCNMTPATYDYYGVGAPVSGKYRRIFSTCYDNEDMCLEAVEELCNGRPYKLNFKLKPYEAIIFEIPFHESTEEELKKEKKERTRVSKAHKAAKSDTSHVP